MTSQASTTSVDVCFDGVWDPCDPENTTRDVDAVTCSVCLGALARQVEAALADGVQEYLEYELEGLLVLHRGQLPKPHEVDRCLEVCMSAIRREFVVQPTPPPDGEGILYSTVHYKTSDGETRLVEIQLMARP